MPSPAPNPEQLAAAIAAAEAAHAEHLRMLRAAHANPTPGPLAAAFDLPPETPSAGAAALARIGRALRPVVAADFLLLKRLNSPLYRQAEAAARQAVEPAVSAAQGGSDGGSGGTHASTGRGGIGVPVRVSTVYTEDELAEMIYQFTTPIRQARAELTRGRAAFTEAALAATLDLLRPEELGAVLEAVVENFTSAFSTALGHQAPAAEGEQRVDFFPASPTPAMASAGGSITSACSAGNSPSPATT